MTSNSDKNDDAIDISANKLKQLKKLRANHRVESIKRFLERSKLGWLIHPEPFEDYYSMRPLPTILAARRASFLRPFSWFSLIRRRSERIYQLGLGGLVLAPLVGWIILHFAATSAHAFPMQLGVLYFSGLFYVLASTLLIWRCPVLIKELCLRTTNSDPDRNKHLVALIEEEILDLKEVRSYPLIAIELEPETSASQLAAVMYASNTIPTMNGFGSRGRYLLEHALLELGAKRGFKVFWESNRHPSQLSLLKSTGRLMEGRLPYVVDLFVRQPSPEEVTPAIHTVDHINETYHRDPTPTRNDLVIEWHPVGLQFPSTAEKDGVLQREHANGLHLIYEKVNIEELAWIITRWQNWRRLLSRLIIWAFYSIALGLFAVYLVMQTNTVWDAMELSKLIQSLWH